MNTTYNRILTMRSLIMSEQDEANARAIVIKEEMRAKERGLTDYIDADHRHNTWVGKMGQWGFHRLYPAFKAFQQDFVVDNHDSVHPITAEDVEIKTYSITGGLWANGVVVIDKRKFNKHPYDICVFCAYNHKTRKLIVIGWGTKAHLEAQGVRMSYEVGDPVYGADRKLIFHSKESNYGWFFDDLDDMDELAKRVEKGQEQPLLWKNTAKLGLDNVV